MIDFECRLNLRKFVCRYGEHPNEIPKNTTRIPLPLLCPSVSHTFPKKKNWNL